MILLFSRTLRCVKEQVFQGASLMKGQFLTVTQRVRDLDVVWPQAS